MTIPAEPIFDYYFEHNVAAGYTGWHFKADYFGPQQAYAPGDIILAQVVTRVSDEGTEPVAFVQGITTDGSDWTRDVAWDFYDNGHSFADYPDPHINIGAWYRVSVFRKVWTADDPVDYEAFFAGVPDDGSSELEDVHINFYAAHGGDGAWTLHQNQETGINDAFPGAVTERNFGDGVSSWGWTGKNPQTTVSGTWGYHPGIQWFYYEFTGVNVYGATIFGEQFFGFNNFFNPDDYFFHPADSVDEDGGEGGTTAETTAGPPYEQFTLSMLDVIQAAGVRASRRASAIHGISVT